MGSFEIKHRSIEDIIVLELNGPLIGDACGLLRDTVKYFVNEGKRKFILQLGGVSYIDSAGNGEIITSYTTVRNKLGQLYLTNLTRKIERLFQIQNILRFFKVFDNVDDAVNFYRSAKITYCGCPFCGRKSLPFVLDPFASTTCGGCRSTYTLNERGQESAFIESLHVKTYENEDITVIPDKPFRVQIEHRLTLFSSSSFNRLWVMIPKPRRVIFELGSNTKSDDPGRAALLNLAAAKEPSAKVAICLEKLPPEEASLFPSGPPVYSNGAEAYKSFGNLSDTPSWIIPLLTE